MLKWLLMVSLAVLPQLGTARVYMCIDKVTGETSFTDKNCETLAKREEVRVEATNLDSGSRYKKDAARKTWNSEREVRKSGRDYLEQRNDFYNNTATAGSQEQEAATGADGQAGS